MERALGASRCEGQKVIGYGGPSDDAGQTGQQRPWLVTGTDCTAACGATACQDSPTRRLRALHIPG